MAANILLLQSQCCLTVFIFKCAQIYYNQLNSTKLHAKTTPLLLDAEVSRSNPYRAHPLWWLLLVLHLPQHSSLPHGRISKQHF